MAPAHLPLPRSVRSETTYRIQTSSSLHYLRTTIHLPHTEYGRHPPAHGAIPSAPLPLLSPYATRTRRRPAPPSKLLHLIPLSVRSPPRTFNAVTGYLLPHLPSLYLYRPSVPPALPFLRRFRLLDMPTPLPGVNILARAPTWSLQHGGNTCCVPVLYIACLSSLPTT